jgi:hypothetical protein
MRGGGGACAAPVPSPEESVAGWEALASPRPLSITLPASYPCGPTRSLIGGTLAVSQVNFRQLSFQPPSIVASIE